MSLVPSGDQGVVRIGSASTGEHAGMGVLVAPNKVLTCAHVINVALQRPIDSVVELERREVLQIKFPTAEKDYCYAATIDPKDWKPRKGRSGDLALLTLVESAPVEVGLAILAVHPTDTLSRNELSLFYVLKDEHAGLHVEATLSGKVSQGWTQLYPQRGGLQGGASGGAVWSHDTQSVVGVLVSKSTSETFAAAYMIPCSHVAKLFKEIPFEVRTVNESRNKRFVFSSIILFILMLLHFLGTRSESVRELIPWAQSDSVLSGFFGSHIYIFLAPLVILYAIIHAKSFSQHKWYQRVALPMIGSKSSDAIRNTPVSAVCVIFLIFLSTAWFHGHGLKHVLLRERAVYMDMNKVKLDKLKSSVCGPRLDHQCTDDRVGLWKVPNLNAYFNNVYQIDGEHHANRVTFFPILQPAVLLIGTLINWLLLIFFFISVFKKSEQ